MSTPTTTSNIKFPWDPDSTVQAGFASINIQNWLLDALKNEHGVHTETLMTAIGALAGYAAQYAILETTVKEGKLPLHGGSDTNAGAFVIAGTAAGEKFYMGDLLNSYLVPQSGGIAAFGPGEFSLLNFVAGAVASLGQEPLSNEQVGAIFGYCASTLGTEKFGVPNLPVEHMPGMMPRDVLNGAWPTARLILGTPETPAQDGRSLPVEFWPTVLALVAQKFIIMTKDVLAPALAMQIIFEAAIPMSKVDPETVPQ